MIGRSISHYKITAKLGSGGMGVVYRAKDSKLRRDVAIKMLHPECAANSDLLVRLRKEARTLAGLSHPNVGGIFGFEEEETGVALILELVEGPTLSDLIRKGPLDTATCLEIGCQIAQAIEYAHSRGILHCDLKPANIKVGPDRRVRVLDFGLATHKKSPNPDTQALTATLVQGGSGSTVGTPSYMSPEQVKGEPVDERSDHWAFGCTLFEMVTGKKAFQGKTIPETTAAVLNDHPMWGQIPDDCPAPLLRLIKRCLQKDPMRRLRSAGDALLDLQEIQDFQEVGPKRTPLPSQKRGRGRPRLIWGLVAIAFLSIGALFITRMAFLPADPMGANLQFDVLMPYGVDLSTVQGGSISLAPTADRLAYVASEDGRNRVMIHRFDQAGQTPVPGTEEAGCVRFSPDGNWLAFATPSQMSKIHLATQRVVPLCRLDHIGSICWSENDSIYFAAFSGFTGPMSEVGNSTTDGIYALHANGGEAIRMTAVVANDSLSFHCSPTKSANGRYLLFAQQSNWAFSQEKIMVRDNRTGAQKVLIRDGRQPTLLGDDRLLFLRGDKLLHVFVDLDRGELISDPITVQTGISGIDIDPVSVAEDGSLAFITSLSGRYKIWDRRDRLALVDRNGDVSQLDCKPGGYALPSFTPDGKTATFTLFREMGADIWAFDLSRGIRSLLTQGGSNHVTIWTPNGRHFLFSGDRLGEPTQPDIFIQGVDGSEAARVLVHTSTHLDPVACTPDGKTLVFWDVLPDTKQDLFLMPLWEPGEPQPYLHTTANEAHLSFSPDGKYIAYTSDESGVNQVYIKPFMGPGGRIQISATSGREPLWHPSGGEIFFLASETNRMYSVEVDRLDGEMTFGAPRPMWDLPIRRHGAGVPNYALHPDGEHFLVIMAEEAGATKKHIRVALRWQDGLERRFEEHSKN